MIKAASEANERWRVLFMGTPDFAIPTLEALIEGPDQVVAVVAQPDRPAGRGRKMQSPPTIRLARAFDIPTLQPRKVRGRTFREAIASHRPDLVVVAAYGRILTEAVLAIPRLGCINVHASLLPRYRGASPIQWAILNGDQETGVTIMQMDVGLDTGDILLSRSFPIGPNTTAGSLHDELAELGAELLLETIRSLKAGMIQAREQEHSGATLAPMLNKEDGLTDWSRSAAELDCHVRGMTPWPSAYTFYEGKRIVITKGSVLADVELEPGSDGAEAGTIVKILDRGLVVATGKGLYLIEKIKAQNGKEMDISAYLNGHEMTVGNRFCNKSGEL